MSGVSGKGIGLVYDPRMIEPERGLNYIEGKTTFKREGRFGFGFVPEGYEYYEEPIPMSYFKVFSKDALPVYLHSGRCVWLEKAPAIELFSETVGFENTEAENLEQVIEFICDRVRSNSKKARIFTNLFSRIVLSHKINQGVVNFYDLYSKQEEFLRPLSITSTISGSSLKSQSSSDSMFSRAPRRVVYSGSPRPRSPALSCKEIQYFCPIELKRDPNVDFGIFKHDEIRALYDNVVLGKFNSREPYLTALCTIGVEVLQHGKAEVKEQFKQAVRPIRQSFSYESRADISAAAKGFRPISDTPEDEQEMQFEEYDRNVCSPDVSQRRTPATGDSGFSEKSVEFPVRSCRTPNSAESGFSYKEFEEDEEPVMKFLEEELSSPHFADIELSQAFQRSSGGFTPQFMRAKIGSSFEKISNWQDLDEEARELLQSKQITEYTLL